MVYFKIKQETIQISWERTLPYHRVVKFLQRIILLASCKNKFVITCKKILGKDEKRLFALMQLRNLVIYLWNKL